LNKLEHWLKTLKEDGCRITSPRRVILEVLINSPRALQPAEVHALCRQTHPGIGLVTVYRTLERLESLGLIQRVHREDGCHLLMPAADGHEHYLVCTTCGRTILFKGDNLAPLFTKVESRTGYQVSEHWLQLFGTCPDCQLNSQQATSKVNHA
jgi:Fe2+ or Zn2+ uptake regulation protein